MEKTAKTKLTIQNTRFIANNFLCGACIIGSIVLSMIMVQLGENPTTDPFSAIGKQNRLLFIFWGATTAAAVYFNLCLLATRLNVRSNAFEIILAVGCSMGILTTLVIGLEPLRRVIHVGSAMIFGVTCVLCLLYLMIVKLRQKRKRTTVPYLTAMLIAGMLFILTTIYYGWFTAFTQILLSNVCLVAMFGSNIFEKWREFPKNELEGNNIAKDPIE